LIKKGTACVLLHQCVHCGFLATVLIGNTVIGCLGESPWTSDLLATNEVVTFRVEMQQVAVYRWQDLMLGKFECEIVDFKERGELAEGFISSYEIDRGQFAVMWTNNYIQLPCMKQPSKLEDTKVKIWSCIVKVDKNRYAVSGLNQTTDPYTQVIKLVDSQLRPVSSVSFSLTRHNIFAQVSSMKVIGHRVLIAKSQINLLHVLQYHRGYLTKIRVNADPFESTHEGLCGIYAVGKKKAVIGIASGLLAIIKLTFH